VRTDLFDRLGDVPGSFAVAHYHPEFSGDEPCARTLDAELTASPWSWLGDQFTRLGAGPGRAAWPLESADAAQLSGLSEVIVTMARRFAPDRCGSASECFALTCDARQSVQLMIEYLRRPDLLDLDWVAPWTAAS
jgi:hypothetical protein